MSLVGHLEDLGLGEILQIVSLSRKTGILTLTSGARNGSIIFRNGQVVRASSSTFQQGLGEVLIQKGVIDPVQLRKALLFQQDSDNKELLGVILIRDFNVSQEVIEDVVREQIENIVFSFFSWSDGTFNFETQANIESFDLTNFDPLQFMLNQGLNPQFLAMEGTRILDEHRHSAESPSSGVEADDENELEFNLTDSALSKNDIELNIKPQIVIVDDDGPTLRASADALIENGFVVNAMNRSEETLIKIDSLHRGGECPVVIIDLIMPKMDGSGVLGGIELLELLHNNFNKLHIIVVSDYQHADAEAKVRGLGYNFIIKPRRVEIGNPQILQGYISRLLNFINKSSNVLPVTNYSDRFNLGDELRIELGDEEDLHIVPESQANSGGLSLLRGMLEELNNPDLQGGILLLILRFASEFFNRAIVFTVNDNVVFGSGQFGIRGGMVSGDERVRSIHFTLEADSIFNRAHYDGRSFSLNTTLSSVDKRIFEQLGGGIPSEVFVGPIASKSKLIGFLYGDNLSDSKPIADTESLSIFLSQAGFAVEKSRLEQKLHERAISD